METLDVVRGDLLAPPSPAITFPTRKQVSPGAISQVNALPTGVPFLLRKSIYVDNKAVLVDTRQGSVDGGSLLKKYLLCFGLIMRTGTTEKRSKMECMHMPAKQIQSTAEDTTDLVLDDGFIIHFCSKFLSDSADITNRLNKANSAFSQLQPLIFSLNYVPFFHKRAFYISCVVNILLWGCENWSLHIEPMSRLKTFHTKCCRAIIGVTMWKVDDYSITNENILKHVGILSIEDIVHHRRLVWMGKIARMPLDRFPRKFLAAWMDCLPGNSYSRPHSRRQLSTRDSFLNSLEYIGIV